MITQQQRDELERLLKEATPGPWLYRPQEFDDWGYIRDGTGAVVATARAGGDYDAQAHRWAGTDPFGPNAQLIVAAVSALPALLSENAALREGLKPFAEEFGEGIPRPDDFQIVGNLNLGHFRRASTLHGGDG